MMADFSDFVLVADPIECLRLAREASAIEGMAMQLDLQGQAKAASEAYRRTVAILHEAMRACPDGHPDALVLEKHASEVLTRVDYLESLDGQSPVIPLEEHILCVQLTLGSAPSVQGICNGAAAKVMGAAAAITGATGLLVLGPWGGCALGMAAAIAARRDEGQAGCAARRVGHAGLQLYSKAKEIDRSHRIRDRVAGAVFTGMDKLGERHKVLAFASVALKAVVC